MHYPLLPSANWDGGSVASRADARWCPLHLAPYDCCQLPATRTAGIRGAKGRDKRPGFDAMLKDASRRKFDSSRCYEVSRPSHAGDGRRVCEARALRASGLSPATGLCSVSMSAIAANRHTPGPLYRRPLTSIPPGGGFHFGWRIHAGMAKSDNHPRNCRAHNLPRGPAVAGDIR